MNIRQKAAHLLMEASLLPIFINDDKENLYRFSSAIECMLSVTVLGPVMTTEERHELTICIHLLETCISKFLRLYCHFNIQDSRINIEGIVSKYEDLAKKSIFFTNGIKSFVQIIDKLGEEDNGVNFKRSRIVSSLYDKLKEESVEEDEKK